MGAGGRGHFHVRGRRRHRSHYDGHYYPYEDGKKRSRGQKIVQIRQRREIFGLGTAARLIMCDSGRALLLSTAHRMREEVMTFGDCLAKERIALLKGLDHLEAPLLLIERLLAPFTAAGRCRVDFSFVNTACRHYHMAIDAYLAVAPSFRKAQKVRHKWIRNRGKICAKIRSCCSKLCCGCHCHKHPPMARRMSRARKIFEDLEIRHEACVIDLALTYEYYLSSPEPPPPDAPARCLAAASFILAAQRKLHQVNCHFLQPRDKVTMGMAEWTLDEAAEDLRVAHAKLKTLPRRMRSGRRRGRRPPPLVTFISPPDCVTMNEHPWWRAADDHCGPCGGAYALAPSIGHEGLPPHRPMDSTGHVLSEPAPRFIFPTIQPTTLAHTARAAQLTPAVALACPPAPAVTLPVEKVQLSPVLNATSQLQLPSVAGRLPPAGIGVAATSPLTAPVRLTGKARVEFPVGQPVLTHAINGGVGRLVHNPTQGAPLNCADTFLPIN